MGKKSTDTSVVENGAIYVVQAGTPIYLKTADICSLTGKSNQWVGQLTSQGVLNKTQTPHGSMYELFKNIKSYCGMLEKRSVDKISDEEKKAEKDCRTAEVTLKVAKAIKAKLEAAELQNKMHRSEDVAAMTEDLVYTIRGALNALPGVLAIPLSSVTDPAEISVIVKEEVNKILSDLARYKYDSKKYEERVRTRLKKDVASDDASDDEE